MRVTTVGPRRVFHLLPTLEGGGTERRCVALAMEQARRGMDVHVGFLRGGVHLATLRHSTVTLYELGSFRQPAFAVGLWRLQRLIARIEPEIVQTWLPLSDIVGGFAAICHRIPWIISEATSAEAYDNIDRPRRAVRWLRAALARFARAVVANSQGGLDYWRKARPSLKAFLIPNAIPVAEIERAPSRIPEGASLPYVLYAGRFAPPKDTGTILDAVLGIQHRVQFCLVMIGEGRERAALERRAAEALPGRVLVLPYDPDWWGMLKTASAFIAMSRLEGRPNTVCEAMAGGCPLIVSDIPAHRALLDDQQALFVPSGDAAALGETILAVLGDPGAAQARATRARTLVTDYTADNSAALYENVYREVAGY